ncbi:SDR family oxidoreductase [Fibrella forsythiae]|uniref:SDR family NAD(P)-dependent oxidoreductase n=1 Tax=Fibrella forsythiae TaxID=2817061 RepID=A0ABS3JKF9_9BACT|nr:SDR family NAD(P)-dependent oxidoreductase [Fibrella forsythiae]MBO0950484.1 SDR family NAD(P)-dependent oxidoreductase [Fibrella forsythiae]
MILNGKRVLITGGGSGIGLEAVKQFYQAGAILYVCGRNASKLAEVQQQYPSIHTIVCDVSDQADVDRLVAQVVAEGGIDILFNNAGVSVNTSVIGNGASNIYEAAMQEIMINYLSVVRLNERFIPHLEKSASPIIINTSSVLAYVPAPVSPTYSASKSALHAYTIALRLELKKVGSKINVFELMPPVVDTPMADAFDISGKLPPSVVIQDLIKALEKGQFEVRPGQANVLYYLHRFMPKKAQSLLTA